ncbi:hypothetical protein KUTeg_005686 [Tegillarca granosa]|uniref:Methyltransferase FkbM domain-containing protein n=1 Tax=Tegillarca granosa TaxID=220873 RepID=A0ABQ9FM41_TEGGR|nr:hypothetical protein KUTeg_005686 [Tegillarca granosa]
MKAVRTCALEVYVSDIKVIFNIPEITTTLKDRRDVTIFCETNKVIFSGIGINCDPFLLQNIAGFIVNPRYIILEPLEDYVKILEKKFEKNPQVVIYNLGLGAKNEKIMVKLEGSNTCATSKFLGVKGDVPIYISNAIDFFTDLGVGLYDVDLLTMNCEGCEYEISDISLYVNIFYTGIVTQQLLYLNFE